MFISFYRTCTILTILANGYHGCMSDCIRSVGQVYLGLCERGFLWDHLNGNSSGKEMNKLHGQPEGAKTIIDYSYQYHRTI